MQVNILSKNIELTEAIKDHVMEKVFTLEKVLYSFEGEKGEAIAHFEVGKNTNHHKAGFVFHADCRGAVNGEEFYASADQNDLYQAIDEVRENLFREIGKHKDRKLTLFKRGAMSVKKMLKGLSKRNPFTSKY